MDINNTYTESDLGERIYIRAPEGFEIPKGCILLVIKSLYRLKQSANKWNNKCDKSLKSIRFKRLDSDPCVYIRRTDDAIIRVYVNNLLILAPTGRRDIIDAVKDNLRKMFKIKDLGPVNKILGMQVTRDRTNRTLCLDQVAYIEKFLHHF